MREGARCPVTPSPHIVQLVRGLHLSQAIPVARDATCWVACWVQEIQLAADTVPVAPKQEAPVLW